MAYNKKHETIGRNNKTDAKYRINYLRNKKTQVLFYPVNPVVNYRARKAKRYLAQAPHTDSDNYFSKERRMIMELTLNIDIPAAC